MRYDVRWEIKYEDGTTLRQIENGELRRKKDIDESRVETMRVLVNGKAEVEFQKRPDCVLIGPMYKIRGRIGNPTVSRTLVLGQKGNDYSVEYQISEDTGRVRVT